VPKFVNPDAAAWHQQAVDEAAAQGIRQADSAAFSPFYRDYRARNPEPPAMLEDVVRHCEHIREVAGIDHVGVGGDYDGVEVLPQGMGDVTAYPALLEALAERGWSDDDLAKLTSGNILRVMREAEAGARALQAERGPSLATIAQLDVTRA
jgi:membrane dipeptidase